ncbi:hypothetical protein QYF36_001684 [Acer negundo]|nr:hypothetical protein QYF36_001684 [Acer negundo]
MIQIYSLGEVLQSNGSSLFRQVPTLLACEVCISSLASTTIYQPLFSGHVKAQQCEAMLELLSEFRAKEGLVPDAVMLINVLGACALQAALNPGKEIHAYMLRMALRWMRS